MITKTKNYIKKDTLRTLGILGTLFCISIYIAEPSFPTPDKLLIFLFFVFMIFGQAKDLIKRLLPFVVLLIVYEMFRGLVPGLNHRVNFLWMPSVDRWMFGVLPTEWLQQQWWHGSVMWYDFLFYLAYMAHFVFPIGLAILVWKKRVKFYWKLVTSYIVLSFMGFITYFAFPAAPPWMASDRGLIEPITRVSSSVWSALGIHDFPSVYNKIAPNPVAAVPSLHAAYAVLFALIVYKIFGKKWGMLATLFPIILSIGIVYQGEHYVIDVILGVIYAFVAFYITLWASNKMTRVK